MKSLSDHSIRRPYWLIAICALIILFDALYPSDLASYRDNDTRQSLPGWVELTDTQMRFTNTIAQVALPLLLRDGAGMMQLVAVAITATAATHGLKWLLNDITISGTRLGERPYSPASNHNMPSGHSSMASCAAYFVARRYGYWNLLYLLPITLLTMAARVMLEAHTVAAVIAGCLIGIICAAWWTSPYQPAARR
jgi:lipid A 1-phosphatase